MRTVAQEQKSSQHPTSAWFTHTARAYPGHHRCFEFSKPSRHPTVLPDKPITGGETLPLPLQERARESIESHFDFSKVRIHTDDTQAARHNALAYAIGADIVLGRAVGAMTPVYGMRVLGHELAHVVQQHRGGTRTTSPRAGNVLEQSADRAGRGFAAGQTGRVEGAARVGIARTPRSLSEPLVPSSLSDTELENEIREIRAWLMSNNESSTESDILEQALAGLEAVVRTRATPTAAAAPTPPVPTTAGCPSGRCHQPQPSASLPASGPFNLTPEMLPTTAPSDAELNVLREWLEQGEASQESTAVHPAAGLGIGTARPTARWVPIVQHMHLGTFGDTVAIVTAPWQGAVQRGPDPSAGYNFDTYITNPKSGELIPAQHLGGTRYRVFMGTPECPGCHFGQGLQVDIMGENPLLIFGPTLVMTGLAATRPAAASIPGTMTPRAGPGWTPRVIPGGGAAAAPRVAPAAGFAGNTALELNPIVAQAPAPSLHLVPTPAPVALPPPVYFPNPALPAIAAMASAGTTPQTPVMPSGLSQADQALWQRCNRLHDTYKATQTQAAGFAGQMDPLRLRLEQNQATPQERLDFCELLGERIRLIQRLHQQRLRYMDLGCDRFDWFNTGTSEAERRTAHQTELDNVSAQIDNLFALQNRLCAR
jgi:hypothetical protein